MLDATAVPLVRLNRIVHEADKAERLEHQKHRVFQLLWPHLELRKRFEGKDKEDVGLGELADEVRRVMIDLKTRGDLACQDIATLRRKLGRLQRGVSTHRVLGEDADEIIIDDYDQPGPRPRW